MVSDDDNEPTSLDRTQPEDVSATAQRPEPAPDAPPPARKRATTARATAAKTSKPRAKATTQETDGEPAAKAPRKRARKKVAEPVGSDATSDPGATGTDGATEALKSERAAAEVATSRARARVVDDAEPAIIIAALVDPPNLPPTAAETEVEQASAAVQFRSPPTFGLLFQAPEPAPLTPLTRRSPDRVSDVGATGPQDRLDADNERADETVENANGEADTSGTEDGDDSDDQGPRRRRRRGGKGRRRGDDAAEPQDDEASEESDLVSEDDQAETPEAQDESAGRTRRTRTRGSRNRRGGRDSDSADSAEDATAAPPNLQRRWTLRKAQTALTTVRRGRPAPVASGPAGVAGADRPT